jgi:serine/threonine protein kinase
MASQIGKYELKQELGRGASATVYLAVDTFSNTEVALKVLDAGVFESGAQGKTLRKQFLTEASLAGKLKHPHVVAILDAVMDDESGYIAMEYIAGGDLSEFTRAENLLPESSVTQIGFKCCGALDYAYRQGIVHRDIKPANIMAGEGANVKITDFGASYLQKRESTQLAVIGTPYYLSPEQIIGDGLTHHSDMFCLGVVLYELLTGQRPFSASNVPALLKKIQDQHPVPPSRVRPSISKGMEEIVLTMLHKSPSGRFASWADLALEMAKIGRFSVYENTIADSEKYTSLRRVEMLRGMNDAEIWELVHAGAWTKRPSQSLIIREDEPGRSLFFLAAGELKVTKQGRLLNVIGAGECFGEMSYIRSGQMPRHASIESMTEVTVAEFDAGSIVRLSPKCQGKFTLALLRTVVDRLDLAGVRLSQIIR